MKSRTLYPAGKSRFTEVAASKDGPTEEGLLTSGSQSIGY